MGLPRSQAPPSFSLQYGKVGRAWYLFSREHDVIDKWPKKKGRESEVSCIIAQPTTSSTLGVHNSRPSLVRYKLQVTWYLSSSCCSQCTNVQSSPFYHLSTLDVTPVRKDTRPSVSFVQPQMIRRPRNEASFVILSQGGLRRQCSLLDFSLCQGTALN